MPGRTVTCPSSLFSEGPGTWGGEGGGILEQFILSWIIHTPYLLSQSQALIQVRQTEMLRMGDPENRVQTGQRWARTPKQEDNPLAGTVNPFDKLLTVRKKEAGL